jgi:hemoglobin
MNQSLYERLGGSEKITKIASDLVDNHLANLAVSPRYADLDIAAVKNGAATFFISGTGGPNVYEGKDMLATHKGMNISDTEFNAVIADVLNALEKNDIGAREQEEVLYILFSMRPEIVHV